MARMLADGRKKFIVLAEAPVNKNAVTLAEATAGKDYSKAVLASDFDLGFTASDKFQEKDLSVSGNAETIGNANFGGGFTIIREFDKATGLPDPASISEELWELAKEQGSELHALIRHNGKKSPDPVTAADEYVYAHLMLDLPQSPGLEGNIKQRVDCAAQEFSDGYREIVAGP